MKKIFRGFAVLFLSALLLLMIFYPYFGWGDGLEQNVEQILMPPSSQYWFGTDSLGRDIFVRVLSGGRISLIVGLICAFTSFVVGFTYGTIAAWFEGLMDRVLMRLCDILMAIPSFILVSILCLSFQLLVPVQEPYAKALLSLCLGISATHWMSMARITRGMVLEAKRRPYVDAARALGGTQLHIMLRHILPNIMGTLLILIAMQVPTNILYESFMSFIGLGIQPPQTSWGILVREGWKSLSSFPHLILFPSLVLFLTVWSFHMLLDAFKEKFNL